MHTIFRGSAIPLVVCREYHPRVTPLGAELGMSQPQVADGLNARRLSAMRRRQRRDPHTGSSTGG